MHMLLGVKVKVMVCDMFSASLTNNLEMVLVVAISFLVNSDGSRNFEKWGHHIYINLKH